MVHPNQLPRSKFMQSPSDALLRELADIRSCQITPSTQIGYLLLNRDRIGEDSPIVMTGGFMSSATTPDIAYGGAELASVLNRPVLAVDMPGHGISTPHSRKQIIDLCLLRSADSQAEPLTDAVQKILGPDDRIDHFGISHGGLLSLLMAKQDPTDRVGTVFAVDVPAVKRRSTLGLQIGYMYGDNIKGRKQYHQALQGSSQEADYENFKALHNSLGVDRAPSFARNNLGLFVLNLVSSINASPVALEAWQDVMNHKTSRVNVFTSANGKVSDHEAISQFINQLPPGQCERSQQTVIEGENHNIAMTHLMPRAARWAEAAYSQ